MGVRVGMTARGSSSGATGRRRIPDLNEDCTAGDFIAARAAPGGESGELTSPKARRPYMRLHARSASDFRLQMTVRGALTQSSCLPTSRTAPCRCLQRTA